jgi:hypothetical protein
MDAGWFLFTPSPLTRGKLLIELIPGYLKSKEGSKKIQQVISGVKKTQSTNSKLGISGRLKRQC